MDRVFHQGNLETGCNRCHAPWQYSLSEQALLFDSLDFPRNHSCWSQDQRVSAEELAGSFPWEIRMLRQWWSIPSKELDPCQFSARAANNTFPSSVLRCGSCWATSAKYVFHKQKGLPYRINPLIQLVGDYTQASQRCTCLEFEDSESRTCLQWR